MQAFTKLGYMKTKIPDKILQKILQHKKQKPISTEACYNLKGFTNCEFINSNGTLGKAKYILFQYSLELTLNVSLESKHNIKVIDFAKPEYVNLHMEIVSKIQPIIENWSGQKLSSKNVALFGIRRYLRGSWMSLHVDKLPDRILSAILQIDQKVDEDWPLTIIDNQGNKQKIFLKPGEMLLYESAKVPHGRPFPLKGDFYDNVFIHFQPLNWIPPEELICEDRHSYFPCH